MKYRFILLLIFSLVGCKEITYREPQPKGKKELTKMPDDLIGEFIIDQKDTLVITSCCIKDPDHHELKTLSALKNSKDSIVFKRYKGYYFVSSKESGTWRTGVIKVLANGDLECDLMPVEEKTFPKLLADVSKIVSIDSARKDSSGERRYQIDPTPKQLVKLYKAGLFSQKTMLVKIKRQP